MTNWIKSFIEESNKIEGIFTEVTQEDILTFTKFIDLEIITIGRMEEFVSHFQPGARLREKVGQDVYVGNYTPPAGGSEIIEKLENILNITAGDPYYIHRAYETLHPFTDCNGRSGRAIFAWQAWHAKSPELFNRLTGLGFLHTWYYESLNSTIIWE